MRPTILGLLLTLIPVLGASGSDAVPASIPAGTTGVARTAIEGQEIIEIPVVFLGVMEDAIGPGYDLYLVRLEGEVGERIGVAAGMSGSPVYVDGEIVGALAYRLGALPKEAIGGVTPIQDILDASMSTAAATASEATGVSPIATPVFASGVLGPVLDYLRPQLEEHGFVLSGGGGRGSETSPASLEPGSPVGLELVRGDMSIGATGTVTWVDDGKVFVFGHPFLGAGSVELPLTTAEVIHTIADQAGSVKLTRPGTEVGAVFDDRLSAAVGRLGARASMMPVTMGVRRAGAEREFHFEIVRHSRLAPILVGVAAANALFQDLGFEEDATVQVSGSIALRDLPDLRVELSLSTEGTAHPFAGLAQFLSATLQALYTNPFEEPEVEAVDLVLDVRPGQTHYRLETVRYDRGPVLAGSQLEVHCVLRSFRGEQTVQTLRLGVPEGIAAGTQVALAVGQPEKVEQALGRPLARRLGSAPDLASYVAALGDRRPSNRLEAVLYRRASGAVNLGELYAPLPPTAAHLLARRTSGTNSAAVRVAPLATTAELLDGPLEGGFVMRFEIGADRGGEED